MAAHEPPLLYVQVKFGPSGSCLDYLYFGACKNARCSYKHVANTAVQVTLVEEVAPNLDDAYPAYNAAH